MYADDRRPRARELLAAGAAWTTTDLAIGAAPRGAGDRQRDGRQHRDRPADRDQRALQHVCRARRHGRLEDLRAYRFGNLATHRGPALIHSLAAGVMRQERSAYLAKSGKNNVLLSAPPPRETVHPA